MEILIVVILFLPLAVAALVILASPFILVREWKRIRRGPAPEEEAEDLARLPRSAPSPGSNGHADGRANGHLPPGPRRR